MAQTDDEKLMDQAIQEVAAIGNRPVIIETDLATAMDLIAMVQLALRHPGTRAIPAAARSESAINFFNPEHDR